MLTKLTNDVFEIIDKFSEIKSNTNVLLKKNIKHISIELMPEDNYFVIIITHCSLKNIDKLKLISYLKIFLKPPSKKIERKDSVLLKEADCEYEVVFNITRKRICRNISRKTHHPHLKEYLIVKIKLKLSQLELEKFGHELINYLQEISEIKSNTLYNVYWEGKLVYKNQTKLDEIFNKCTLLGSAISEIIISSLDFNFMEKCYEELNISDPGKITDATTLKLFSLFHDQYNIYKQYDDQL